MSLLDAGTSHEPSPFPSFTDVFTHYHPRIFRYLRSHQFTEEDAADLTQQVFVQAWVHQRDYQPERGSVGAWLFGIARHLVSDFHRHTSPTVSWDGFADLHATESSPEELLIQRESLLRVQSLLDALAVEEQELLALRFAGRLTSVEIATLIGKSAPATKRQLSRLLRQLHEQYYQNDHDDLLPDVLLPAPLLLRAVLRRIYEISITPALVLRWSQFAQRVFTA